MEQIERDNLDNSTTTIAVVSHKSYRMPADSMYLPLHVGATLHPHVLTDWAQDNIGENISRLNLKYSELTGLYWLWKNNTSSFQGLVHYRRYLGSENFAKRHLNKDRYARIITFQELHSILGQYDIVLPRKRNYYIETIQSHYAHTFPAEHLGITRKIIDEMNPEYRQAFDYVMSSKTAHMFNMFVMNREKLGEYCSWLFPILGELESRVDDSNYDSFNARYPGRVSEMLLDVWLYTNGYSYAELPIVSPEPVNWVKKGGSFLLAKFAGKKYKNSF